MYKAKVDFLWFSKGQEIEKVQDNWIENGLVEPISIMEAMRPDDKPVKSDSVTKKRIVKNR